MVTLNRKKKLEGSKTQSNFSSESRDQPLHDYQDTPNCRFIEPNLEHLQSKIN